MKGTRFVFGVAFFLSSLVAAVSAIGSALSDRSDWPGRFAALGGVTIVCAVIGSFVFPDKFDQGEF